MQKNKNKKQAYIKYLPIKVYIICATFFLNKIYYISVKAIFNYFMTKNILNQIIKEKGSCLHSSIKTAFYKNASFLKQKKRIKTILNTES